MKILYKRSTYHLSGLMDEDTKPYYRSDLVVTDEGVSIRNVWDIYQGPHNFYFFRNYLNLIWASIRYFNFDLPLDWTNIKL